jgi:hypothetical protein
MRMGPVRLPRARRIETSQHPFWRIWRSTRGDRGRRVRFLILASAVFLWLLGVVECLALLALELLLFPFLGPADLAEVAAYNAIAVGATLLAQLIHLAISLAGLTIHQRLERHRHRSPTTRSGYCWPL